MSFIKLCELADQFEMKIQDENDAKTQIPSWVEDHDAWLKAKKKVKNIWNKQKNPYATIVHIYKSILEGKKKK